MPILVVLTVLVIFQLSGAPSSTSGATPTAPSSAPTIGTPERDSVDPIRRPAAATPAELADPAAPDASVAPAPPADQAPQADAGVFAAADHVAAGIPSGALPVGDPLVLTGAGTWHVVPGTTAPVGTGPTPYTYSIEVEDGLQTPEQDQAFAAAVDATLSDARSWIGLGQVTLARVDTGQPTFRISLTSAMTIRSPDLCGWEVPLEASCYNRWAERVLVNDARWVRGAMAYGTDVASYRTYAINHEVGHALGYRHEPCPEPGAPAPVMMQQSWSTADNDLHLLDPDTIPADGKTCVANPYPRPDAAPAPAPPPESAAAG